MVRYLRDVVSLSKDLALAVDASGVQIDGAFWIFDEEAGQWFFYLASPQVAKAGPRAIYAIVNRELRKLNPSEMREEDIRVTDHNDENLALFRRTIPFVKPGLGLIADTSLPDPQMWNLGLGYASACVLWTYHSEDQRIKYQSKGLTKRH